MNPSTYERFKKWCEANHVETNNMVMTYYDETYTDYQVYILCQKAFEAGFKEYENQIQDILLGD